MGAGIAHLRPMNISRDGKIDLNTVKYVEVVDYPKLRPGDIIFNNTNSPEWVGKTAYITTDSNWTFSNHMTRIRLIDEEVDYRWVAHYLHFLQAVGFFQSNCTNHVNQASINVSFLEKRVSLPLAPLAEQRRIVEAIEAAFTKLDAGVAALKRLRANLKRYKAAVLKAAAEGTLVPQDPTDEPAAVLLERILRERRQKWETEQIAKGRDPRKLKYEEPKAPDTDDLPDLPEGWVWASLGQITYRVTDGTHQPPIFEESGIPFIFIRHINSGKVIFKDTKFISKQTYEVLNSRSPVELGDILYSAVGSYGIAVPVWITEKFAFQRHIAHIKPVTKELTNYLSIFLNSHFGRFQAHKAARGVAQKTVTLGDLSSFVVPLPPENEMGRIVNETTRELSVLDQMFSVIETNLKRAERLRQAILRDAFAGRLVQQDPTDEPVSELLKRIQRDRAQRANTTRKKKKVDSR